MNRREFLAAMAVTPIAVGGQAVTVTMHVEAMNYSVRLKTPNGARRTADLAREHLKYTITAREM